MATAFPETTPGREEKVGEDRPSAYCTPGKSSPICPAALPRGLEMKSDLTRDAARSHEVSPAEGGKEVVKRDLIGEVDGCQARAPLVMLASEQIVMPNADIEQMARRDSSRIFVVVLCSRCGNIDSR